MNTRIWAHRGASGYAPENTLEAFELAVRQKADGVELDVQLSKDGELVVMHDETVDRVTDGRGYVKDYTLKELKAFKVCKPQPAYSQAVIPALGEVYDLLKGTALTVNVELKTGVFFYEGIEEKLLRLARDMGMEDRIWYSSFNHASLVHLKELDAGVRTGILYADGIWNAWDYAKAVGVDALHPSLYNMQYPGYLEKSRELGLETHVWTVDGEDEMDALVKAGVEAIITDYPDRARKVLSRQASPSTVKSGCEEG